MQTTKLRRKAPQPGIVRRRVATGKREHSILQQILPPPAPLRCAEWSARRQDGKLLRMTSNAVNNAG